MASDIRDFSKRIIELNPKLHPSSDLPILPEIRIGALDPGEEQVLWPLYTRHGPRWTRVQLGFPTRTAAQLRYRAMTLIGKGPLVVH
jgi:hypothetical protein